MSNQVLCYLTPKTTVKALSWAISLLGLSFGYGVQAATLIPDLETPMSDQAQVIDNGRDTPMLFVVAPNARGVSYNRFHSFQLDARGLVIVNGSDVVTGQTTNQHARRIIIDVASEEPTILAGLIQVQGAPAALVLINSGSVLDTLPTLYCNRCRFDQFRAVSLGVRMADLERSGYALNVQESTIGPDESLTPYSEALHSNTTESFGLQPGSALDVLAIQNRLAQTQRYANRFNAGFDPETQNTRATLFEVQR